MPPAVLADSDDDGDDIATFECEDVASSARGSRRSGGEGAKAGVDGADEGGTGSTEHLRRQIQSAERGLLSNSAPGMNQQNSSASPARQAAKRRHTVAFTFEGTISPQKGVKRTKTLKTYGASRRQLEPNDDNNFDGFQTDDGPAAATSQSVRFSEHSGHQSSMPLPAGSLQSDFLNHEPAVMFKDTGDTVADASSEQQRLLEHITGRKAFDMSLTKEAQYTLEQQSSSIPWTASDIADSSKSKKNDRASKIADENGDNTGGLAGNDETATHDPTPGAEEPSSDDREDKDPGALHPSIPAKQTETTSHKPRSSPMVEIPRQQPSKAVAAESSTTTTRRDWMGRSPQVEHEKSEPLNSDDRAIGLPKEQYQPRPSRRRATQVVEEPIDYSMRPEKAAKVKRTRTTGANDSVATSQDVPGASQDVKPGVSPPGLSKYGRSGDARKDHQTRGEPRATAEDAEDDESPIKPRRTIKQDHADPSESGSTAKERVASPAKPSARPQQDEDKIFVKPAVPTPKPKGSSKAKRAQTTIFEDHVEFLGSRRSPNLSQQQAKRKSALQDVQNDAAPKPQRKRKSVVADDDDDDDGDELAKENETLPSKAESPPQKRRGRPPKRDKQAKPKANDSVPKDSDKDEDIDEHIEADQPEDDEPAKRRGRGRPAKVASRTIPEDFDDTTSERNPREDAGMPQDPGVSVPRPGSQPASTPSKPSAPATEIPTPSPEKPTEKMKATPQKAASSNAQHSPIKSSSMAPYRVGLSKNRRIPPLLRMTKPPKR